MAAYGPHPAHVAVVEAMTPIRQDLVVVDYLLPPVAPNNACCGSGKGPGPSAHCWVSSAVLVALTVGATLFFAKRK